MTDQIEAAPAELPYFSVSNRKLLVMTLSTFGLYGLYWFYQNWTLIKKRDALAIKPFWRAFFAPFFCHPCFKDIQDAAEKRGLPKNFDANAMAVGWFLATVLWRLPDPYWLVTHFAVFFMLPVQTAANEINRHDFPGHEVNSRFSGLNILGVVVGGLFLALSIAGTLMPDVAAAPQ